MKRKIHISLITIMLIFVALFVKHECDELGNEDNKKNEGQLVARPVSNRMRHDIKPLIATEQGEATLEAGGVLAENLESRWGNILAKHGGGDVRNELIYKYFLNADITLADAIGKINKLSNKSESRNALTGLTFRIASISDERYLRQINRINTKNLTFDQIQALVGGLAFRIDPVTNCYQHSNTEQFNISKTKPEAEERSRDFVKSYTAFDKLIAKLPDKKKVKCLKYFFESSYYSAPETALKQVINLLDQKVSYLPIKLGESFVNDAIALLVLEKGEVVLDECLASGNGLLGGVRALLQSDFKKGLNWFENNNTTLAPDLRNVLTEDIAKKLTLENKFDDAQKWVSQLTDVDIKNRAIRGMANFRTAEVKRKVEKSPQSTVETLQSESHLESPILIGVAINEWLNKDPDKAGKWFFENNKSMGNAERDYSAEAFVRYGIKVGDLDAARQWAAQHSSEEKRREYLKQIDHAAVEQKYQKDK